MRAKRRNKDNPLTLFARSDAELVVDEQLDGGFVDLADEHGAVESADGDLIGAEGFFHGVGAVADEHEKTFALTLGGFDGEGDVEKGNVGKGGRLEVVDEFAELLRGLDVAPEENKSSRLELAETTGGFGIEFGSGDTGEEELAEGAHDGDEGLK